MVFVSVTRLRLRSWRFWPSFLVYALLSQRQARRAAGNISADVLNDAHSAFWTCSVWQDEGAMRAFMTSGPHRRVMPKLLDWCDEAALVHWNQESAQRPSWQEAHRRMRSEGRRSKVRNPSPAQERFEIPIPRV